MSDLNVSVFTGNLVRDCEYKVTNGHSVVTFSVASNRSESKVEADGTRQYYERPFYFQTQLFGKTADNIHQYLKKGIKVSLQGHWENVSWEKDGKKYTKNQFYTESLQFISSKKNNGETSSASEKTSEELPHENFGENVNDPNEYGFPIF